jgi:hypothetical protein
MPSLKVIAQWPKVPDSFVASPVSSQQSVFIRFQLREASDTIILPVVLYGYETWSLILREERRLGVFENRVLRRIFGPKRDEVTGKWKRLQLSDLYSSPNVVQMIKSRRMRSAWHVARMVERRGD